MKGNLKALFSASILAALLVCILPIQVFADPITVEGQAAPGEPDAVKDSDGNPIENFGNAELDVYAEIIGSSEKIIYSILIEYGDMKFSYDFGQTWDPETHTYSVKKTEDYHGGWVVRKCIDGKNNAIKVTNNSNYPVTASFSYSAARSGSGTFFNSSLNGTGNVIGIFSENNSTLADGVNTAEFNGYRSATAGGMITAEFDLDMDYSNLEYGTYVDYGVLRTPTGFSKTMYFTLCGTPDDTLSQCDFTAVGKITVKVQPADASKVQPRPDPNGP